MSSIIPPFLQPGDTIGICASARWISEEQLDAGLKLIAGWGFKIKLSPDIYSRSDQFAGTDTQRRNSLQQMLDDPEIKAILFARGGYGTVRIIDDLDFKKFYLHPKWICGYSDLTVLHAAINNNGIATIHSSMPISFSECTPLALENLRMALTGRLNEISWKSDRLLTGSVQGRLTGGNLSVLYSIIGSGTSLQTNDGILFIEDVDEMLYHIDRMMMNLRRSGMLENTRAIIAGGLTQMRDNTKEFGFPGDNPYGRQAHEIIADYAKDAGVPFLDHFPAGHCADNRAFYLGREVRVDQIGIPADGMSCRLSFID